MPEIFKCPACGAPLEYKGTSFQKCEFCGNSVIVPTHELTDAADDDPMVEIRRLIADGQIIMAIKRYREIYGVGLAAAKDAVEAIRDGEDVHTPPTPLTADVGNLVGNVAEVRRLIAAGRKIEAIKLFRETFGVGLKEAKDAVESIERGEHVNVRAVSISQGATVDGETVKKVGYAIGGSILGTFALTAAIILVVVGAIFFVVFRVVSRLPQSLTKPLISTPSKPTIVEKSEFANTKELLKFGGEGVGAGKFADNRTVAVAADGKIYSADRSGGRIQAFEADGTFIVQFTGDTTRTVDALACDRAGNLFVLQGYDVYRFNRLTGENLGKYRVDDARDIDVGLDGKLYVATRWAGIAVLSADGKRERVIKFGKELGIENVDMIALDGAGNFFVLEGRQSAIFKLASDGTLITRFGGRASGANRDSQQMFASTPQSMAVDSKGRLFVCQTSQITVFDPTGNYVGKFAATQAFGIAFDDQDQLFVASRPFVVKYKVEL